jgi:hypothetical protein
MDMNKKYYLVCNECGNKMYELINVDLLDEIKRHGRIVYYGDFLNIDGSKVQFGSKIDCKKCGCDGGNMVINPKFIEEEEDNIK